MNEYVRSMVFSYLKNIFGGPLGAGGDLKQYFESHEIIFKCSARGSSEERKEFEVYGFFNDGLPEDRYPSWSIDEINALYANYDGFHVYTISKEVNDGFIFYSASEVLEMQRQFLESIEDCREDFREESFMSDIDAWIDGLLPIAEPASSGDYFVFDTYEFQKSSKCLIHRLDHEMFWGGCLSPDLIEETYKGVNHLLKSLVSDPLYFFGFHWVGGDFKNQWYPEGVLVSSK